MHLVERNTVEHRHPSGALPLSLSPPQKWEQDSMNVMVIIIVIMIIIIVTIIIMIVLCVT